MREYEDFIEESGILKILGARLMGKVNYGYVFDIIH